MIDVLLGIPLGLAGLAYLLRIDHEQECIDLAAKGGIVDIHKLTSAYWNKVSATYVRDSVWVGMSRNEKAAVLTKREELKEKYANFEPAVRYLVNSTRPRDVRYILPQRTRENLLRAHMAGHKVGHIVWIGERFGFVRPGLCMADYYFDTSDAACGISRIAIGDIVNLELSENKRGLYAKSILKYHVK